MTAAQLLTRALAEVRHAPRIAPLVHACVPTFREVVLPPLRAPAGCRIPARTDAEIRALVAAWPLPSFDLSGFIDACLERVVAAMPPEAREAARDDVTLQAAVAEVCILRGEQLRESMRRALYRQMRQFHPRA